MDLYGIVVVSSGKSAAVFRYLEDKQRTATFEANKRLVLEHNAAYRAGEETYWLALNEFADISPEEFSRMRGTKYNPHRPTPAQCPAPEGTRGA